jgi:hypothetical protein
MRGQRKLSGIGAEAGTYGGATAEGVEIPHTPTALSGAPALESDPELRRQAFRPDAPTTRRKATIER